MNQDRRKRIAKVLVTLEGWDGELVDTLQEILDEEQEVLDNLPENLANSERGEAMRAAVEQLEEALEALRELDTQFSTAKEALESIE